MKIQRNANSVSPMTCTDGSALVEESALGKPLLVLSGDGHVGRGQQEHLVGHTLDAATCGKNEPGREVDEALPVIRPASTIRVTVASGTGVPW